MKPAMLFLAVVLIASGMRTSNAQERYRVEGGDKLNIEVYQLNELSRRAPVDIEGNIHMPAIGTVRVAGLTLTEIQKTLTELLANGTLVNPQIIVELVETRPVFINGDVSKPGEYDFRPGMSIRQLVAVAGGYDLLRFRAGSPMIQIPDFQAERDMMWLDLARQDIRNALLSAELAALADVALPRPDDYPIPSRIFGDALKLEQQLAAARAADRDRLKTHLRRVILRADEQITALQEQRRQEESNVRQLTEDMNQTQSLFTRGLASLSRVQEQQRSIAFSQSRLSESIANIALAARNREESIHRLQNVDEERRIDVLQQIERGAAQVQALRLRLNAVAEKLLYSGALRSQLLGESATEAELVVYRKGRTTRERLVVTRDTMLMPGDSVEVTLKLEP